jgi:hypothetical protein
MSEVAHRSRPRAPRATADESATSRGSSKRSRLVLARACRVLAILAIVASAVYRARNVNGALVYEHSWGEGQYALWADAYRNDGFFWGHREEAQRFAGFTVYVPVASLANAALLPDRTNGDPVALGRLISYAASLLTLGVLFRGLGRAGISRGPRLAALAFVSFAPLFAWFGMTFYNEPLSMLALAEWYVAALPDPLAAGRRRRWWGVVILTTIVGLLKPTNLAGPVLLSLHALLFRRDAAKRNGARSGMGLEEWRWSHVGATAVGTLCVTLFFASQRLLFADQVELGVDRLIGSAYLEQDAGLRLSVVEQLERLAQAMDVRIGVLWAGTLVAALALFGVRNIRPESIKSPHSDASMHDRELGWLSYPVAGVVGALATNVLFLPGTLVHTYYILPAIVPLTISLACVLQTLPAHARYWSVLASLGFAGIRGDFRRFMTHLEPDYSTALPAAMRYASTLLQPGDACMALVGWAIPNHEYYLSGTKCRYHPPDEAAEATTRARRLLASDSSSVFVYQSQVWRAPEELARCDARVLDVYVVARCRAGTQRPN